MSYRATLTLAASLLVSCGSSTGNNANSNSGTNSSNSNTTTSEPTSQLTFEGIEFNFAPDVTQIAALDDGVVIASFGLSGPAYVIRVSGSGELVWAKSVTGIGVPKDLLVGDDSFWVVTYSSPTSELTEFSLSDGSLIQSGGFSAFGAKAALAPDGGIVVAARGFVARLSSTLEVQWAKGVDGMDATISGDDLFVGNGVGLTRMTMDGDVVYRAVPTFDGAGNSSMAGIRELPDGRIMVASGADAPVTPPLFVATYSKDGTIDWLKGYAPAINGVGTQFGSGVSMAARGSSTFVGYVANSGGLGSDVRGRAVTQIEPDGTATGGWNAGTAVTIDKDGLPWAFSGQTINRAFESNGCDIQPADSIGADIEHTVTFLEGAEAAATDVTMTVTPLDLMVEDVAATLTAACPVP